MNPKPRDVKADRQKGERWEANFCRYVRTLEAEVIGAHAGVWKIIGGTPIRLMPNASHGDVIVRWSARYQLHEIKSKYASADGEYGLEVYRYEPLREALRRGEVYYSIFDTRLRQWLTAEFGMLAKKVEGGLARLVIDESWYGGEMVKKPTYRWSSELWTPLSALFGVETRSAARPGPSWQEERAQIIERDFNGDGSAYIRELVASTERMLKLS